MKFALVAAACEGNGIGINNKLPWKIKYAFKMFITIEYLKELKIFYFKLSIIYDCVLVGVGFFEALASG